MRRGDSFKLKAGRFKLHTRKISTVRVVKDSRGCPERQKISHLFKVRVGGAQKTSLVIVEAGLDNLYKFLPTQIIILFPFIFHEVLLRFFYR